MVTPRQRTRSDRCVTLHRLNDASTPLLWNTQRVLTKSPKHRIVSKFHADAFTHYHKVSRVYRPATFETNRVFAEAIPMFRPSMRT
jgi:hypothetical protein